MNIHPREQIVDKAEDALVSLWLDKAKDLTDAELLRIIAGFIRRTLGEHAKYAIRHERHGDYETPGGVE